MSQTKSPLAVDPQAIAHAAAERLLAHALDYYEMVEHAAHEWQALASHYEAQSNVPDLEERKNEAEKEAFYQIGLAVGRMTSGVR